MGYSCTAAADDAYGSIQAMFPSKSNFWTGDDGKEYFLEQGKENRDGAITGTVIQMNGQYGKKVGSLRIEPSGYVTRFPHLPKHIRAHVKIMNTNIRAPYPLNSRPAAFQVF